MWNFLLNNFLRLVILQNLCYTVFGLCEIRFIKNRFSCYSTQLKFNLCEYAFRFRPVKALKQRKLNTGPVNSLQIR
ncbi:hypothetical protein MM_0480 [Methanosarcina mazei Go1]|uniref:Uncharacterized protein n=1 Tax=Methanosarcina mazei (strain ATCC BAA-159 / DSM 3647 / Goe1 / Go1 / JCM 11833 / OCM 88) TaxID=192952 RepID=Q8PZL2_METMA|nr:hypothetical protein MM_0480 [Methanosarcina mazei Go1]